MKYYSLDQIELGVLIACDLMIQGIELDRIPGFYRLPAARAYRAVDPGILVPTRNCYGQIVGLQTRLNEKLTNGLRYMTVSSKGLDGGVTDNISRTHYCVQSAEINRNTKVFITEGPLKADTALSLYRQRGCDGIAIIALQGVCNTRELPEIAAYLKGKGVTQVTGEFDMDKLLNISVARAKTSMAKIFAQSGIKIRSPKV